MLRFFRTALVFLTATTAAAAQEGAGELFARRLLTRAAFEEWTGSHGPGWQLSVDERTGRADFVGGGRAAPTSAPRSDAEWFEAARRFVEATESMTGIEAATLAEHRVKLLPLGLIGTTDKVAVRFLQEQGGLPVLGGAVNVLLDVDGGMLSIQSTALPHVAGFPTRATLDARDAGELALAFFESSTGLPGSIVREPLLGVGRLELGKRLVPALVWEVDVQWREPGFEAEGLVYWIDARDGELLDSRPAILHFDIGGQVRSLATPGTPPDTGSNPEVQIAMPYLRVTSSAGTIYTDALGNFNYPGIGGPLDVTVEYFGTYANVDEDSGADYVLSQTLTGTGHTVVMNPTTPETVTSQANAFLHIAKLRDWVRALDPTDDTADFQALANVNLASTCNAYFDGGSVNFYASGGGCVNTAYSTVVAHEMGHWLNVLYNTGNGSDGMGEGNADIFAMYLYDTPILGDGFFGPGTFIRSGLNTLQFCGDCCSGCHGGGVHTEGQVWMGAAWKIRVRLNSSHGNAMGDAIANGIFSGWMNAYDQTQIKSVNEIQWLTLDDDNGTIDDGTPHYFDIDQGFRDQGFPGFDRPAILFPAVTLLPDTTNQAGPYQVDATVIAQISPPIQQVELFHRVNGGAWQSVTMVPSGIDQYIHFIPGTQSPSTVDYYIRARDAASNILTFPTEAPDEVLQFHVGILNVVFFDDFEGDNDGGWSHGSFGDTPNDHDDFQRGIPAGSAGDPSEASSGTKVFGNDLGQDPWNGLYQNNQHDWLRSPLIDCSRAVNSELRFRRWLTVEKGINDRALVRVNGVEVWSNPLTDDLLDAEWVFQSLDISSIADGAAAVEIEFSLESDADLVYGGWNVDEVELRYLAPVGGGPGVAYCFGDGSGTPCPCANSGGPGEGCANSSGAGAVLTTSGSASVAADDLAFAAGNLLPSQPALLFAGENAVNNGNGNPFGDGLRCAGGNVKRLGVRFPDANGAASWGPGLAPLGGWNAGDTRRFQCWYRNPTGSPCGTSFNLSHGVAVSFVP